MVVMGWGIPKRVRSVSAVFFALTAWGQVPEQACQEVLAGRSMRGFASKARHYSGMPEGAGGLGSLVASDLAQIRRRFGQVPRSN
jgi:hypothetical protein